MLSDMVNKNPESLLIRDKRIRDEPIPYDIGNYKGYYKPYIYQNVLIKDELLILSGFGDKENAHATCLYFKKINGEDKYDVFINSGAGLENHKLDNKTGKYRSILNTRVDKKKLIEIIGANFYTKYGNESKSEDLYKNMIKNYFITEYDDNDIYENYSNYMYEQLSGNCIYKSIVNFITFYCRDDIKNLKLIEQQQRRC